MANPQRPAANVQFVGQFFGLKPYQQQRITAFLDPDIDKQGSAWAINQSLIAIGSGGWSGKGFKAPNTQIELGFLPATAVHNDYIFSAIGEQWGFVGGMFLLGGFALLLFTCLFVAFFAGDQFGLLLVVGITGLIFTHIFQNMGMTISLLPITGVPLPLISYSGSFVLMIMFGLVTRKLRRVEDGRVMFEMAGRRLRHDDRLIADPGLAEGVMNRLLERDAALRSQHQRCQIHRHRTRTEFEARADTRGLDDNGDVCDAVQAAP